MRLRFRTLTVLLVSSLFLLVGACKSSSGDKPDEPLTQEKPSYPTFFEEIPAESLYVYTGLEPVPRDLTVAGLEQASAVMTESYFESMRTFAAEQSMPKAFTAILDEMQGNLSPEGLEELGLSLEPSYALYGVGGMPIFRMKLGDAEAFRAMVNRVESKTENPPSKKEADGVEYRLYEYQDLRVPLVIRDGEVVVGATHVMALEAFLPYVLGTKKPEESLAGDKELEKIAEQYGYQKWAVGYGDLEGAIRKLSGVDEQGPALKAVLEAMEIETPEQSEVCRKEIGNMAATAPRAVVGLRKFSAEETVAHAGLEMKSELATELSGTVEPIIGMDSTLFDEATMAMGLGLNVKGLMNVLQTHLKNIDEDPYECEHFSRVNSYAKRFKSQPLPPVIGQLRGATLVLERIEFGSGSFIPTNIDALAVVGVTNPQSVLGRLQPFVPGLMQANVKPDGVPVPLSQLDQVVSFLKSPHLAMKEEVVAFSTGVGMQDELAVMLENPPAAGSSTMLAFSYNFAKLMEGVPDSVKDRLESIFAGSMSLSKNENASMRVMFDGNGIFVTSRRRTMPADTSTNEESKDAENGQEDGRPAK